MATGISASLIGTWQHTEWRTSLWSGKSLTVCNSIISVATELVSTRLIWSR